MEYNRMEDGKHLPQRGAWLIPKDQPSADRRGRGFFEGISRRTESWGCFPSSICTALCPTLKPSEGGLKITACQGCLPKGGNVLSLLAWCLLIGRCSQSQPLCHWETYPVWDLLPKVRGAEHTPETEGPGVSCWRQMWTFSWGWFAHIR